LASLFQDEDRKLEEAAFEDEAGYREFLERLPRSQEEVERRGQALMDRMEQNGDPLNFDWQEAQAVEQEVQEQFDTHDDRDF